MAFTQDRDVQKFYARLLSTGDLSDISISYEDDDPIEENLSEIRLNELLLNPYSVTFGYDIDVQFIHKILEFIYLGDYNFGKSGFLPQVKDASDADVNAKFMRWSNSDCHSEADLWMHAMFYFFAENLWVSNLQERILQKLESACAIYWDTESFLKTAADTLTEVCLNDEVTDIIIKTIAAHFELIHKDKIRTILRDIPRYAFLVLEQMEKEMRKVKEDAEMSTAES
ncbi:hypothetical protein BU24DRAFT_410264 [Aaosphaeria arxii CBS 175.79]|uniref:BTB domain-containing protein n=1 Tax=Aaosphaeria arxii CBS 175.79 TaxID=1450172 RepID=A0A6A5XNV3_9PLEO|nr:uncharacterized protein BU24DRAFT_410264 [Aaosphaeria arxii CBS 175.79]KAF2014527.1 hypothetical protein BU24DRAFT_410264 [Aaosphaeria arxii CBS 175.79]